MTRSLLAIGSALFISACSFVETKPGAENIILANDMTSCQKLGETTVVVLDTFLWMDRREQTIADELQTLAQNSAVRMNGNAIWPITEIEEGQRTYKVMRCEP